MDGKKRLVRTLLFLILLAFLLLGVWIRGQFGPPRAFPSVIDQQAQVKLESTDLFWGWTKTEVISDVSTAASSEPAIAIDNRENVHLVWSDLTDYLGAGTDDDIFHRCWNATMGTWGSIEVVSFEHNSASYAPSIAVDKEGNLHIVWIDTSDYNGAGTDEDIFYKCRNATTGKWAPTVVVSDFSESYSANPDIAADMDGNIHIVWVDSNYNGSGSDGDIFYRSWNATTGTWTETELVTFESDQTSNMPKMAVDLKGTVHVVWTEYYTERVYYKYRNMTTYMWSAAEWVSTESLNRARTPQIAVDAIGTVYVAWVDHSAYGGSGSDQDIFYKTRNGTTGTWTTTQVLSTESSVNSGEPAIIIDRNGNLHATWRDADIFYKFFNASTGLWAPWELVSSESTGIVSKPTIAVDPAGDVHIAWEDTSNYQGSGTDRDIFYKRTARLPDVPRLASILPNRDTDGIIELTWTAVKAASTYYLYRDASPIINAEGRIPLAATTVTNYTDTLFSNGGYFYAVVASTDLINGTFSNCENVTVAFPLDPPRLSQIEPNPDSDGTIQLNWSAVPGATQYYLYQNTSAITSLDGLRPIRTVTANNSVELLTTGGLYYYAVVAGNAWVNSTLSNCENVTVSLVPTIPNSPTLSPISPNPDVDGLIQLNWTNMTGATTYYVYRSSSKIISVSGLTPIAAVSQYAYQDTITGNGTYYYVIVAADSLANSSRSNCENVTVILIIPPPSAPLLNPISPNPDFDGLIQLNWTNITGATTYYVYRSSSKITSVSGLAPIAAVSRCGYQDRLYRNGTAYYVIVASNLTGNSSISNCESVRGELFIRTWINLRDFRFLNVIRQDDLLILEFNLTRSVSFPVNITMVIVGENFAVYNHSFSIQNNSLFIHIEMPYKMAHFLDQGQRALQVRLLYNGTQVVSLEVSVTVLLSVSSILIVSSVIAIGAVTATTVTYQVEKRRSAQKKVLQFLNASKSQKIAIPVLSAMTQLAPQKASQILTKLMGRNEIRGALKGDTFYRKQKTSSTARFQKPDEGAWDVEDSINKKIQPVNLLLESLVMLFQSREITRETFEVVKAELLAERRKLKQELIFWNKNL